MSGEHLISDEETRRFAEGFLSDSPWLGDHKWERIVIGPNAEYHADFNGVFPEDSELLTGQQWSWRVSFSDPGGKRLSLDHATVLKGIDRIVYGEVKGAEGFRYLHIQQWFTEPTPERQKLQLRTADHSLMCQRALYDKIIFPAGESPFGEKLDLFEEQRANTEAPEGDTAA
ncbi:hypothetical protein [Streptomyces decoyicus]|uniref:hypothetical protein n=1 Tax=Streptomyces decoyicus TaxID=249567 RepID=UPI0038177436